MLFHNLEVLLGCRPVHLELYAHNQNDVKLDFDIETLGTKNVLLISEDGPLAVGKINNNKINPIRIFNIVGKRDVDK
jgi:hypothetical protein